MYEFPRVLGHSLKPKYDKIKWHHNSSWFSAWCKGETGYPIVDAGMRQMNTTGYMHNRSRLIVASFLVKTLLIDWREGEKYFAQTLTDYDVANNNGNWGWISSGGADSQPFFRIFNPSLQGENFDKECEYIKKWVPELATLHPKIIHNWETEWVNHKDIKYPKPICNYSEQREKALKMYKDALY
jgi:deoxyribodipyrimidine photo-lyase